MICEGPNQQMILNIKSQLVHISPVLSCSGTSSAVYVILDLVLFWMRWLWMPVIASSYICTQSIKCEARLCQVSSPLYRQVLCHSVEH